MLLYRGQLPKKVHLGVILPKRGTLKTESHDRVTIDDHEPCGGLSIAVSRNILFVVLGYLYYLILIDCTHQLILLVLVKYT